MTPAAGRVLVVDPDDASAAGLTALLDTGGFTTLSVAGGPAAVAAVLVFDPDAAVLSALSGEAAVRLLSMEPGLRPPTLVLTPDSDPETALAWVRAVVCPAKAG